MIDTNNLTVGRLRNWRQYFTGTMCQINYIINKIDVFHDNMDIPLLMLCSYFEALIRFSSVLVIR